MLFVGLSFCSIEAVELEQFVTNASVGGELRTVYQYNSRYTYLDGESGQSHAGVLGGNLNFTSGQVNGFDAVLGGYGAFRAFEDKNRVDIDYLNNRKENGDYALLGESFVRYTKDKSYLQVGRFTLDTPLLNSDDVRMTPDFHEGVYVSLQIAENLTFDTAYIDAIAGWENLGNNGKFENIGKAIDYLGDFTGYQVDNSYILFAGAVYEDEHLSLKVYDYLTQKVMNQLYAETTFKSDIFELGAQYLRSVSDAKLKESGANDSIDSTLYGIKGGINTEKLKLLLGYNESFRKRSVLFDGGTPDFFGGANDPLYTSMDVLAAHRLGGVKVYKGEVIYTHNERLSLDLSYASFHKGDGYDQSESDLLLSAGLSKTADVSINLSTINETDTLGNVKVNNRARALVKLKF